MFNRDHGSIADYGPNPGNWGAGWPVAICRICPKAVVFSCELM